MNSIAKQWHVYACYIGQRVHLIVFPNFICNMHPHNMPLHTHKSLNPLHRFMIAQQSKVWIARPVYDSNIVLIKIGKSFTLNLKVIPTPSHNPGPLYTLFVCREPTFIMFDLF